MIRVLLLGAFLLLFILPEIFIKDKGLPKRSKRSVMSGGGSPNFSPSLRHERLHRNLSSKTIKRRIEAAKTLATEGSEDSILPLIDALSDESRSTRLKVRYSEERLVCYWANYALKKLTRENFGFSVYDEPLIREQAILRWRRWLSSRREKGKLR